MRKTIMTIDQLVKFCEEQNFTEFDSNKNGYKLCVSVPATFEQEESDDESMLFANIRAFHTNKNNNGSNVTKKAMENSLNGFKYKPILCNYQTVTLDDGTEVLDFTAHDMEIDDNGNIVYLEKQVGCITSDDPVMKYDKKDKRYYVYAKAAIPREYTPAAEIIERRGGTDVSAELYVNKMSYDAKKKELLLEDIELGGITLLGEDRRPGMQNAHLQIEDFAAQEMNYERNDKLIETLETLNKTLESLNINNAERKEETPMDKFTELLEKYGKTEEDITFSYEGLSDEELETAFKTAFDDPDDTGEGTEGGTDPEPTADPVTDPVTEPTGNDNTEDDPDDGAVNDDDSATTGKKKKQNNSLTKEELFNQLFELSFNEIRQSLNALCAVYRNENEWCYVADIYEDYFIMEDWDSDKFWKQSYTKDGDTISLSGERIQLFAMLLTESEKMQVENMRQNYEQISKDLAQYQKKELVASDDYSAIANKEDFTAIVNEVNNGKNEMTFEELKEKVDGMLLNYAKSGSLNFEANEGEKKKKVTRMGLVPSGAKGNPKKSRYGNLFKK